MRFGNFVHHINHSHEVATNKNSNSLQFNSYILTDEEARFNWFNWLQKYSIKDSFPGPDQLLLFLDMKITEHFKCLQLILEFTREQS